MALAWAASTMGLYQAGLVLENNLIEADDRNVGSNSKDSLSVNRIKYIHNIFISDKHFDEKKLPILVRKNIESFRRFHPGAEYMFWQEEGIRSFLKEHFAPDVLEAFDCLQAFALKADLARYCILYIMGGLYSDLSNFFVNALDVPSHVTVAAFKDRMPMHGAFWMTQNTIIYAQAGAEELDLAIKLCVHNIKNRNYGNSSLEPTGPAMFGRILAMKGQYKNYSIGSSVNIDTGNHKNRSHYVCSDGTLLAIRLQGEGGKPSEMGLKGTNVYGELWERRRIFDERTLVYPFDSSRIQTKNKKTDGGIRIARGTSGHIVYGPYIPLFEGNYTAEMEFKDTKGKMALTLDVCCYGGQKIIAKQKNIICDDENKIRLDFVLDEYVPDLEVRLAPSPHFEGTFTKLNIIQDPVKEKKPVRLQHETTPANQKSPVCPDIFYVHYFDAEGQIQDDATESEWKIERNKTFYPNAFHEYWTDSKARVFIENHFSRDVVSAYDKLGGTPMAADLAKYCLLYIKGGLCVERDLFLVMPLTVSPEKSLLGFVEQTENALGTITVDRKLLFSRPEQPEINTLIGRLTEIANAGPERIAEVEATGYHETMLSEALASHGRTKEYATGQLVQISKGSARASNSYIGEDGTVFAVQSYVPLLKVEIEQPVRGNEESGDIVDHVSNIFKNVRRSLFKRNKLVKA